jgi:hypothetical protein
MLPRRFGVGRAARPGASCVQRLSLLCVCTQPARTGFGYPSWRSIRAMRGRATWESEPLRARHRRRFLLGCLVWSRATVDGLGQTRGLRSEGEAGSDAYGVGSSCVAASVGRSVRGHEGFGLSGRVSSVHGARKGRGSSGRRPAGAAYCHVAHEAPCGFWGRVWQRLRGLAAAVILCSGAQGQGRQTSAVRAVEVGWTMWKASRSVPEISGTTTERMS